MIGTLGKIFNIMKICNAYVREFVPQERWESTENEAGRDPSVRELANVIEDRCPEQMGGNDTEHSQASLRRNF